VYVLSNVKTTPEKMHSEFSQRFTGNHDLVARSYLLESHEAKKQLILNVYFGGKSL